MGRYRFWAIAAAAILVLAVIALTFSSKDGAEIAAGMVLALAFTVGLTALAKWPAGMAFVLRHPRSLIATGVVVAVLGFTSSMVVGVLVLGASRTAVTTSTYAAIGCSLLGILIAALPNTLRRVQASKVELAAVAPAIKSGSVFSAFGEAAFAWRSVLAGWPAFFQITGPWVVLNCGALVVLGWLADNLDHDKGRAILLLLGAAVLLIWVFYVGLPTIAVAWFKWTLEGKRPKYFLALPDRTVFGLAWRLWLFLTIVGTADRSITTQARTLAGPAMGRVAGDVAWWVVMIAAVALASSFALRLPAMAVRDPTYTRTAAIVQGRRMWPALPLGLILSLAPFIILGWGVEYASDPYVKPISSSSAQVTISPALVAQLAALMFLFFAALASGSTLLSRAYLLSRAGLMPT